MSLEGAKLRFNRKKSRNIVSSIACKAIREVVYCCRKFLETAYPFHYSSGVLEDDERLPIFRCLVIALAMQEQLTAKMGYDIGNERKVEITKTCQ